MDATGDEELIQDPSPFAALTKIHNKAVLDCCFSPDTDQILSGGDDSFVVLWDLPPKDLELHDETVNDEHKLVCHKLSDHKAPVTSVAMHDRLFLSASKDGQVKLWKFVQNLNDFYGRNFKKPSAEPINYSCHKSHIRSLTFSPNARCFATASDDKTVKLWSTECPNKRLVSFIDGHTNWVKCVRWSKTSDHLLASCGDDGRICIWDSRVRARQGPAISIESDRRPQYNCLEWHPIFGHHLATGSNNSACVVWDIRAPTSRQVQVYVDHNGSINSLAFNSGGSLLISGSSDKTCKIYDVCEGINMFTLMSHKAPITSVCFNSTGDLFATGSSDRTITVWKRNFETICIEPEGVPYDVVSDSRSSTSRYSYR